MKAKALFVILSKKYKDGEIFFMDSLALGEPKTKLAMNMLKALGTVSEFKGVLNKRNALSIFVPDRPSDLSRSFRNISNVLLEDTRSINPVSLLSRKRILFVAPEETMRILESKGTFATSLSAPETSDIAEKESKTKPKKLAPKARKAKANTK